MGFGKVRKKCGDTLENEDTRVVSEISNIVAFGKVSITKRSNRGTIKSIFTMLMLAVCLQLTEGKLQKSII